MSYAPPTVGPFGLLISLYNDYLAYLNAQYLATYGTSVYLGPESPDEQWNSTLALIAFDAASALQQMYNSWNPLTAVGAALNMIGILIGTARKVASYSTATVTVTGTSGAIISGGVVQDTSGNYWNLPATVTIGGGGTVNVTATAQQPGNITANPATLTIISTPSAGWSSVTNASAATPGQPVEADSQYRARLMISQANPSITLLAGTAAAIAAVPAVTRSKVYENATGSTDALGNPPHSITCVVEGGNSSAIAQAIYANKGIGCLTNGLVNGSSTAQTTTVVVTDPNNGSLTQSISFLQLAYLPIAVGLNVHPLAGFTSVIQYAIVQAVINYLNALGIGQPVVWSEIIGAALTAGGNPLQPTFSISAVQDGYLAATTPATLNSTTVIVVSSNLGIVVGQICFGTGIQSDSIVTNIAGNNITLSLAATATASGVDVTFFTVVGAGVSIAVGFQQAAQGLPQYVGISLV